MQPYFFPYAGYFQLMAACDHFIFLDDVQYIRHGWINRNRILKPSEGWQYVIVPIEKHHRETPIRNIVPHNSETWKRRILGQLQHYRNFAPYYQNAVRIVTESFALHADNIAQLNANCIEQVFRYVGFNVSCSTSSMRGFDFSNVTDAGDWALRIGQQMKATVYINPISGAPLFDKKKFEEANISLKFFRAHLPPYDQRRGTFINSLSIIDLMMFHSQPDLKELLTAGEIL